MPCCVEATARLKQPKKIPWLIRRCSIRPTGILFLVPSTPGKKPVQERRCRLLKGKQQGMDGWMARKGKQELGRDLQARIGRLLGTRLLGLFCTVSSKRPTILKPGGPLYTCNTRRQSSFVRCAFFLINDASRDNQKNELTV